MAIGGVGIEEGARRTSRIKKKEEDQEDQEINQC